MKTPKQKMCFWFWDHDWSKWECFEEMYKNGYGQPCFIQERTCKTCNKKQTRLVSPDS